jgi:multidrug resistance efflux pump
MNRLKLLPWVFGVCLLVGTAAGANRLLQDPPSAGGPVDNGKAKPPLKDGGPVVVTGVVAAEQDLVPYIGSPMLPAARVVEVYVKEGDEVTAGKPLYKFDDAAAKADIAKAAAAVEGAKRKKETAEYQKNVQYPHLVKAAELGVSTAKKLRDIAKQAYDATTDEIRSTLKAYKDPTTQQPLTPDVIDRRVSTDERVFRTQSQLEQADAAVKKAEYDLELAKKAPGEEQVREAEAAVALAEAGLAQAKLVAEECVVKAKVAGVVERLEASPGVVVGPATRTPLLWLVPNGPRIVRAEVVPEFAFKIQNRFGQKVTILDDNNTALTYDGEVQRVSGSFLPKRSAGADFLGAKPQLVLEVIVSVRDPAPPGRPPLRVGQPVRVSIGQ